MTQTAATQTALIIGASRALGLALVQEFADRGWTVIGTVRGTDRTPLHELAERYDGRVEVETVDMTDLDQVAALRERLAGRSLDLLFVNGGINRGDVPATEVELDMFTEVMTTNAFAPMRVIGALSDLVPPTGTIGVMSSSQGSVSINTVGHYDVYRASKSALNQLMRCHAASMADDPRTLLLLNPGHVRTDLGGPNAPLSIEDSIPGVVDTITAHQGDGGLQFLDYRNQPVAW